MGVEPTSLHQALDLAALPVCVLGRKVAEAGSCNRLSERLMRLALGTGPPASHFAVTKGRVELPRLAARRSEASRVYQFHHLVDRMSAQSV